MKLKYRYRKQIVVESFSALGRAVGDETPSKVCLVNWLASVSVLSVEPWGMKQNIRNLFMSTTESFSALGRAVGDETSTVYGSRSRVSCFSALGRAVGDETYGWSPGGDDSNRFSALGRAVGDETTMPENDASHPIMFQCSRSSRGG